MACNNGCKGCNNTSNPCNYSNCNSTGVQCEYMVCSECIISCDQSFSASLGAKTLRIDNGDSVTKSLQRLVLAVTSPECIGEHVDNVEVLNATSNSLRVSWDPYNGSNAVTLMYRLNNKNSQWQSIQLMQSDTTYVVESLLGKSEYEFKITTGSCESVTAYRSTI